MKRSRGVDVVVVGAGITGLVAAFRLRRAGRSVVVLEASRRVGGAIESVERNGFLFEMGPALVSGLSPDAADLLEDAGLANEHLAAGPAARRREVWVRGRLVEVPANPLDLMTSSLLSAGAKLRLLREPWASPPPEREESIAEFARRRLGDEVARLALAPLVAGLWAGDPEKLSARHAFPELWELERRHGSLLRGLRERAPERPASAAWSLRGGLEALPRALARDLDVRLAARVEAVALAREGWRVDCDAGSWRARRLVLACPAAAAAEMLDAPSGGESRALAEIEYVPLAVVGLGVRADAVAHRLGAAGFLAPRDGGLRLLGCLYLSSIFAGRAPQGSVALTAIVGGATDPGIVRWSADRLVEATVEDLRTTLGLRGEPLVAVTRKMRHALPQYAIGHGRFLDLADRLERDLPGLFLAGSYRGGISLGDCMRRGEEVARGVLSLEPAAKRRPRGEV